MRNFKFIYKVYSLITLLYLLSLLLLWSLLGEGVYVHGAISQWYIIAILLFVFISMLYFFIKVVLKVKSLLFKILLSVIFSGTLLFLGMCFFIYSLFTFPDSKTTSINGEMYVVHKYYVSEVGPDFKFYRELNWYSMKPVNEDVNKELNIEYKNRIYKYRI